MKTAENTEKEAAALLKDKKVRPSMIRVKVLKYLLDNRNHPTADRLFSALENEYPHCQGQAYTIR